MADFGSQVLNLLGSVAPVLASAIGGPFAGVAVRAICSAIGLPADSKPDAVSAALMTAGPEQLLALKKADNDFATAMKALDVDFAKLSHADAADARQRQVAVHDSTPAILAYGLTLGFFGLASLMIFHVLPAENAAPVNIMLGALATGWMASIGYFFGSTYGSKTKDAMLFQSVPASALPSPAVLPPGRSESPAPGVHANAG